MKLVSTILLVVFLSACSMTKTVGQYPISGLLKDKCSGGVIEGASVKLRFGAIDFGGDTSVTTTPVYTNRSGEFHIDPPKIELRGGIGGWSGGSNEWPTVLLERQGFKNIEYGFLTATESTYNSMHLTMEPTDGCP